MKRVNVDTTVQEKAIQFPTDARLYHKMRKKLVIEANERGARPAQAFVDKGYRGSINHPEDVEVFLSGRRGLKLSLKKWLKRRSAIEPVIGHIKHDHRMERNYLLGKEGDRINATLSGSAFNLRKLMRAFFLFLFNWDLFAENTFFKNSSPLLIA